MIKRRKLRVGDISISYLIKENKQALYTLIFIHGFPFNKNMWEMQLASLPDDVAVIALDIRGHGNTTSGHGFFSIDVFARDLLAFLQKLRVSKAIACGISMGGYVALRAFEIDSAPFAGLILCDTNSVTDDNAGKLRRFDTIQTVLKHGRRSFSINFIQNVFTEKTLAEKPEVVDLIKSTIRRNTERDICATLLALASRTDTTASLKDIKVPVLIMRGAADQLTTHEQTEILQNNLPDALCLEIPESGHLPNLENPEAFNKAIIQFLTRF